MDIAAIHQRLIGRFTNGQILDCHTGSLDPWIEVAPAAITEVCRFLRDDAELQFDTLSNLCGVDWLETDRKKKQLPDPRVEVVYHLFSLPHRHRLVVKVKLPRWKDNIAGQLPEIPSVTSVWAIADWHEREAYDLVGIRFTGHPRLRRILCAEDWEGHPLRKDYDFPLEYHGIRAR